MIIIIIYLGSGCDESETIYMCFAILFSDAPFCANVTLAEAK